MKPTNKQANKLIVHHKQMEILTEWASTACRSHQSMSLQTCTSNQTRTETTHQKNTKWANCPSKKNTQNELRTHLGELQKYLPQQMLPACNIKSNYSKSYAQLYKIFSCKLWLELHGNYVDDSTIYYTNYTTCFVASCMDNPVKPYQNVQPATDDGGGDGW